MADQKMYNAMGDSEIRRVEVPEHFSSESDNTHLYVPKSNAAVSGYTSLQPRQQLPWVSDNSVRNHAVMVLSAASLIDRQRSLAQLRRMSAAGNDCASGMLSFFNQEAAEVLKEIL